MVLNLLKKSCKRILMPRLLQQKLTILPVLQKGYPLDFIYKISDDLTSCSINLTYALHPEAVIKSVDYQVGDKDLILFDSMIDKRKILFKLKGGKPNTKSTIILKIITDSGFQQDFPILLTIVSQQKAQFDQKQQFRPAQLWILDHNPDKNYKQEYGKSWIEGDMILNLNNLQLWQYSPYDDVKWRMICVLQGIVEPVAVHYNLSDPLENEQIVSVTEKKQSDDNENLSIKGDFSAKTVCSNAFISGHPLGQGVSIVTDGMISGQSLYIASAHTKPKNVFIGCDGVISAKHLSADFLQLALFSLEELPDYVPSGTLVLCQNYPEVDKPVLLCALKNQPKSLEDWLLFYHKDLSGNYIKPEEKNNLSKKPFLSVVPSDSEASLDTNKVVEMRPTVIPNINKNKSMKLVKETDTYHHYLRIFSNQISLQPSINDKLVWNKLNLKEMTFSQELSRYWKNRDKIWEVPVTGLLQLNGWVIFNEENIDLTGPIPYHAGDVLYFNIIKNDTNKHDVYYVNQLEFPLVPYINDITNKVCPNQKLSFSYAFPVQKNDQLILEMAYAHQQDNFADNKQLKINNATFELFIL